MVFVFPFMEGFCFAAGSFYGAAGPTSGGLAFIARGRFVVHFDRQSPA
jgi:hypothetical protein